jgi:transposase
MVENYKDESWLREKYWNEEKSQREIADELDVCRSTVTNWMNKHGIETRSKSESLSDGDIEKLGDEEWLREQYKNQRRSTIDIANELDVSDTAVGRWIKKHGIEARSYTEGISDGDIEKLMDEEWLREQYKNQRKSQTEISNDLDVSDTAVGRWMNRHGIEARSYSESLSDGDIEKLGDEEWLREQYKNQRKSTVDIADELDVCSSTVRKWMHKHGIETRSRLGSLSDGDNQKLRDEEWLREQYKNQRKSTVDIADELEVDSNSVRRWIDKHGIEARSRLESLSDGDNKKLRDGDWLREQYENQQKTIQEIASNLKVGSTTVRDWLRRHGIERRSSIMSPEHTTHIVRSEWELQVCDILIDMGIDYDYESLGIKYRNGDTYYPDFVTDEYVIEVKGEYFSEIYDHKNTEYEKALAAMESLDKRDYVVVGKELPADIHIPWDERARVQDLFS